MSLFDTASEDHPIHKKATGAQDLMRSRPLMLALYRADGKRAVAEIERLVALELTESEVDLLSRFRFLESHGRAQWARRKAEMNG